MTDIDWITPTIVVAIGLAAGLLLAFRGSRNATEGRSPDGASKREDLLQQKDRLLRAIREHQDTADFRDQSDGAETLLALEKEAAGVLRQLSLDSDDDPSRALSPETEAQRPEPGDDAAPPSGSSHMGLKFAGAALFATLLVFALLRGTSERTGDMQITGAGPEVSTIAKQAPMPTAGQPGGAIPGVPPALKPKPSGRVDRARARVSVEPKSELAWAELGYALLDAEGWIDAFQTAQSLREIAPGNPDARVIEAMVRVPMGQPDAAGTLLDEALGIDANHIMALTARGMIRYSGGNLTGAKEDWSRARKIAGPGKGHDELLAMASGSGPGGPTASPSGAGSAPVAGEAAPSGGDGLTVSGVISLATGEPAPEGGVLFIYARSPGQVSGPPVAVKRISTPALPVAFQLGPQDQMIKGMPFPATLDVSVRWDADGNAMTKSAEDPQASLAGVAAGASGLSLELTRP
jgi:hypothetical protein